MLDFAIISFMFYYVFAYLGITLGYHKHVSHNESSYHPIIETVLLYIGLLCGVRSPISWAGVHRMHHAYADTAKDPHSRHNSKWYVVLFSLWTVDKIPIRFVKDLYLNPRYVFFHKNRFLIYSLTASIIYIFLGTKGLAILIAISLYSYLGFGLLNLFGHGADGARNVPLLNLIAPFEGNHKKHHEESNR